MRLRRCLRCALLSSDLYHVLSTHGNDQEGDEKVDLPEIARPNIHVPTTSVKSAEQTAAINRGEATRGSGPSQRSGHTWVLRLGRSYGKLTPSRDASFGPLGFCVAGIRVCAVLFRAHTRRTSRRILLSFETQGLDLPLYYRGLIIYND